MQREIEDLAAVIDAVGGQAHLFGASSGGALALVTQPVLLTIAATIDPHSTGLPVDSYGAAADAAAGHLPHARRATIDVPGHVADPATLAPVLTAFLYRLTAAADEAPRCDKRFAKLNRWRLH